jgi:hypothetical protein
MSILNQFPVRRPLKRQPISGKPLIVGRTWGQRVAWEALKILAQAFALFLLAITLLWLWPLLWGAP